MKFLKPTSWGRSENHMIQRGQADANQARADRQRVERVRAARNVKTERAANRHSN